MVPRVAKAKTPTSAARTCDAAAGARRPWASRPGPTSVRRSALHSQRGFTLLEIALVVAILAIAVGVLVPRLRDPGRTELQAQARRLVMTFRLLRSEAVLHGLPFRLNYDLDAERYWITTEDGADPFQDNVGTLGALAKGGVMPATVEITDIGFPTLGAKVAAGQVFTVFYPDGTIDPTVIHLATLKEAHTLYLDPMSSRLNSSPGYAEPKY